MQVIQNSPKLPSAIPLYKYMISLTFGHMGKLNLEAIAASGRQFHWKEALHLLWSMELLRLSPDVACCQVPSTC